MDEQQLILETSSNVKPDTICIKSLSLYTIQTKQIFYSFFYENLSKKVKNKIESTEDEKQRNIIIDFEINKRVWKIKKYVLDKCLMDATYLGIDANFENLLGFLIVLKHLNEGFKINYSNDYKDTKNQFLV